MRVSLPLPAIPAGPQGCRDTREGLCTGIPGGDTVLSPPGSHPCHPHAMLPCHFPLSHRNLRLAVGEIPRGREGHGKGSVAVHSPGAAGEHTARATLPSAMCEGVGGAHCTLSALLPEPVGWRGTGVLEVRDPPHNKHLKSQAQCYLQRQNCCQRPGKLPLQRLHRLTCLWEGRHAELPEAP